MSNPTDRNSSYSEENHDLPWVNSNLYSISKNESNSFPPGKNQAINSSYNRNNHVEPTEKSAAQNTHFLTSPVMQRRQHCLSETYIPNISTKPVVSVPDFKSSMLVQSKYDLELQKRNEEFSQNVPKLFKAYPREMHNFPFNSYDGNSIKTKGQYENVSQEKCFLINLYIETKDSHLGPFPFEIHPKTNLRLLKLQVEKELDIPSAFQNWILNQTLSINYDVPLVNYGVIPKSSVFLYVDSSYKKPLNERRILELLQMKNFAFYKNNFISAPSENSRHYFKSSTNKHSDDNVLGAKGCQSSVNDVHEPQIMKKITSSSQPKEIDSSLKFKPMQTNCKGAKGNSTPQSLRKSYKNGKLVNAKRKNSNSSDKGLNDMDGFLKNDIRNRSCSIDGSEIAAYCSNESVKPAAKEIENFSTAKEDKDLPFLVTNATVGSMSCVNSSSLVNIHSPGDSIHMESGIPENLIKRKNSKNSILKQIKDIHKTKLHNKVSSSEKEPLLKTEVVINEQIPPNDLSNSSPIQLVPIVSMQEFQFIKTLVYNPSEIKNEIPVRAENGNSIEKSIIGHFVEEAKAIEILGKDVGENSKVTLEYVITEHNELSENVQSNEASSFEVRPKTAEESPLEVYIECTVSKEVENELKDVNTDESLEEKPEINKECAENYDFLLRMENLNLVKNVVNFTCPICFGEFESDQGVILHECLHTFCMDCLARTINYAEEALIKCPYRDEDYSCQSYLQQREIKALVSAEVYEKYLQKSITTAESLAEKSFHCKTLDCLGWCMFEDNINVFHCPVCFHYNCLNCQAIHEGLNCRQYQDKLKKDVKLDRDSEKTLEFLNKMIESGKAMKCPKCDLIVMKKWGCDWLKCCICKTEICWITKGPRWGPAGQGDTSAGCRCGMNGKKCHPSCTYCH